MGTLNGSKTMTKLKDRVVIITGASGKLGTALSRHFHKAGASLVLAARGEKRLRRLENSLGKERVLAIPTDGTDVKAVRKLLKIAVAKFGRVDCVVMCTGTWKQISLASNDTLAAERLDEDHYAFAKTAFVTGRVAFKFLQRRRGVVGLIAHISSHAAVRPRLAGNDTYGPTKAEASHYMAILNAEKKRLRIKNVQVTDLRPATINLPGMGLSSEQQRKAVQPSTIAEWIARHIGKKRVAPFKHFETKEGFAL
jgi:NADP-dependent 3-hydroxy acid dehydrogenase YdfG